jgi:hypothetical protein
MHQHSSAVCSTVCIYTGFSKAPALRCSKRELAVCAALPCRRAGLLPRGSNRELAVPVLLCKGASLVLGCPERESGKGTKALTGTCSFAPAANYNN